MYSKKMLVLVAGLATAGLAATAQEQANIPSIVIDRATAETRKTPLSESEREYWRCVLEHLKGTHSNDAVNIILAACRALHGAN